jgi:tetratricopeptide (TPR) repeat protein
LAQGQAHFFLGSRLLNAGHTLRATREFQEAADAYRQAVKVVPWDVRALTWLVDFLCLCPIESLRAPSEALSLARRARELAPDDAQARLSLGFAEYRAGNWRASNAALQQPLESLSFRIEPCDLYFLAMSHWRLGEQEQALRALQRASEWVNENGFPQEAHQFIAAEAAQLLGIRTRPSEEPITSARCGKPALGLVDLPADVFAWP